MTAFLLALSMASPSGEADRQAQSSQLVGEPPIHMTVRGVGVERTIAEFVDVCFRPRWDVDAFKKAVKASDLAFVEERNNNNPKSFSWRSNRGYLVLNVNPAFSQCALSIGSNQPRTGEQLLTMLRPAIEAELGHPVQENDGKFYLEWTDPDSGDLERITLAEASSEPKQAIWYVFDRTAPGVREKLEGLIPATRSRPE